MEFEEKTTSSRLIYDGRIMQVYCDDVALSDGSPSKREYIRHSGGAGVLALDDEGYVYLVSQFRYPYREEVLEIPAGKREQGEDPLDCAVRELEEEVGFKADKVELLALVYPTPAYTALDTFEQGERREDSYPQNSTDAIVDAMLENGGTHIFVGHDHSNNFIAGYKGMKLCYATKSSYNCYYSSGMTGGVVLTVDKDNNVKEEIVYF